MSKITSFMLRLTVGVGFIVVLTQFVDLNKVYLLVRSVLVWPLLIAFVVKVIGIFAQVARWQLLLQPRQTLNFWTLARLMLSGRFVNLFLPGQLGGDLYRVVGVKRHSIGLLQSTGIVIMERFVSFLGTLLVAAAAIMICGLTLSHSKLSYLVFAMLAIAILGTVCATSKPFALFVSKLSSGIGIGLKWERHLLEASTALRDFFLTPLRVLKFMFFCLVMNATSIVQMYLLAIGLGFRLHLSQVALFMPLYNAACAIPLSVNSLGIREASMVAFFTQMGLPADKVTGLAFLMLIWLYVTDLPYGFLLFSKRDAANSGAAAS